jgi:hypothetical protein
MKARARIVRKFIFCGIYPEKDMKPCQKLVSIVFDEYRRRLKPRTDLYESRDDVINYFYKLYWCFSRTSNDYKTSGILTNSKKVKKYRILNELFEFES